jgi:hypothetical protein
MQDQGLYILAVPNQILPLPFLKVLNARFAVLAICYTARDGSSDR